MKLQGMLAILSIPVFLALAGPASCGENPGGPAAAPGASAARAAPPVAVPGKTLPGDAAVGLRSYLAVSALAFALGLAIIVIRRNAIALLLGIELVLNAAGLNFVAFSKYVAGDILDGQVVTVFLIVLAAAEAAVALAIILNIFHNMNTVTVDEADALKG